MDLFKTLKNVRRRSVETIFESVGVSEKTVDEEFDMLFNKFEAMIRNMNECKRKKKEKRKEKKEGKKKKDSMFSLSLRRIAGLLS